MMAKRASLFALTVVAMAMLIACGGDSDNGSSSGQTSEVVRDVETFRELGDCDKSREGDSVFVAELSSEFLCEEGEWRNLDEVIESSSGKNAKSSSSHKDAVFSSSSKADTAVVDSVSSDSLDKKTDEPFTLDGETQKGPFIKGTTVTAFELENGRTLKQTGRIFNGNIAGNNGRYSIPSVALKSQYAYITAYGSYRNEVSGKNSDKSISMRALVDLSNRRTANINLLTHIEYQRVYNLVSKEGKRFRDAKVQAEGEIFKAFHMNVPSYAASEDLNIFGKNDGDAALLAISILLQGNRDTDGFGELLSDISEDLGDDGLLDEELRGNLAVWVATQDTSDLFSTYRKNVENWKLGEVPDFEKYLRSFWNEEYGFGKCGSDSVPLGTKKDVSNKYAVQKDALNRFVCYDDNGESRWVLDIDAVNDVYGARSKCTSETDGNLMDGLVNPKNLYACNYEAGGWKLVDDEVTKELGGCFERLRDSIGLFNDVYYICRESGWDKASVLEYDTYKYTCKNGIASVDNDTYVTGQVIPGRIEKSNNYVCDADTFRVAKASEILEFNGIPFACVKSLEEAFLYDEKNTSSVAKCENGTWNKNYMRDDRDGRFYKTMTADNVTWMAENLKYLPPKRYDFDEYVELKDGVIYNYGMAWGGYAIYYGPDVLSNTEKWDDLCEDDFVFWYDPYYGTNTGVGVDCPECYKGDYCVEPAVYKDGRKRGLCPEGWHVPDGGEWYVLLNYDDGFGYGGFNRCYAESFHAVYGVYLIDDHQQYVYCYDSTDCGLFITDPGDGSNALPRYGYIRCVK